MKVCLARFIDRSVSAAKEVSSAAQYQRIRPEWEGMQSGSLCVYNITNDAKSRHLGRLFTSLDIVKTVFGRLNKTKPPIQEGSASLDGEILTAMVSPAEY
jgi:hypothetical protein